MIRPRFTAGSQGPLYRCHGKAVRNSMRDVGVESRQGRGSKTRGETKKRKRQRKRNRGRDVSTCYSNVERVSAIAVLPPGGRVRLLLEGFRGRHDAGSRRESEAANKGSWRQAGAPGRHSGRWKRWEGRGRVGRERKCCAVVGRAGTLQRSSFSKGEPGSPKTPKRPKEAPPSAKVVLDRLCLGAPVR